MLVQFCLPSAQSTGLWQVLMNKARCTGVQAYNTLEEQPEGDAI